MFQVLVSVYSFIIFTAYVEYKPVLFLSSHREIKRNE